MDEKFKKAKDILIKYNQEHLLNFYDEITDEQKEILKNEIKNIEYVNPNSIQFINKRDSYYFALILMKF